jgi:hypothetical protein
LPTSSPGQRTYRELRQLFGPSCTGNKHKAAIPGH